MDKKMKKWLALLVFLAAVFLDQITKYFALHYLRGQDSFVLIPKVFELYYLENRGAAFGILQNKGIFFIMITLIFIMIAVVFYVRIPEKKKFYSLRWLTLLVMAGAIGNMIDRVFRGYVVDFFYFSLIDFPVFNVADCYVTLAVFILVLLIFFYFSEEDLEEIWRSFLHGINNHDISGETRTGGNPH